MWTHKACNTCYYFEVYFAFKFIQYKVIYNYVFVNTPKKMTCDFLFPSSVVCSLLDESEASIWGEYTSSMQKHWVCPRCEANLIVSIKERLEHESECQNKNFEPTQQEEAQEMEEVKQAQMNPLRKHYFCDKCDQGFRFTTTEILKHKKSHVT